MRRQKVGRFLFYVLGLIMSFCLALFFFYFIGEGCGILGADGNVVQLTASRVLLGGTLAVGILLYAVWVSYVMRKPSEDV